ncbi:MAG: hypothetical protein BGP16_11735 [Sphingobium sp. 66-54]|nr:MAG: hypothetical protein BGP16_11735 [Sphingobium sp. 66-54]
MNNASAKVPRDVIFLSHAMPEDTEFAVWLGVQLANAGYRVWSEATQLIGGERFWSGIEQAFDTVIGKTVAIVSKVTRSKNGVLDEIERAAATAEGLGIEHDKFIVPITLAPLQRSDLPMQVARQNAIAFHPSWADGLARLLKLLARDEFPKSAEPQAVGQWVSDWFEGRHRVIERNAELMTNSLGLEALPSHVRFYNLRVSAETLKKIPDMLPVPSVRHDALLVTFAGLEEMRTYLPAEMQITLRAEMEIEAFLEGRPKRGDPVVARRDASNHVVNMLRQAWDRFCLHRGLEPLTLASGRSGWFWPAGTIEGNFVRFTDFDGRPRKRFLYGVKTKKSGETRVIAMHWHYAPRLQFALGNVDEAHVEAHVAFTTNGRNLLGDPDKAHKIRRSFCKQWFNEQWRTLHLAYFARLSDDDGRIEMPVSKDQVCIIDTRPERYTSPVSFDPPPTKARVRPTGTEPVAEVEPDPKSDEEVPEEDPEAGTAVEGWDDLEDEEAQ